jgi:chloride channel protein, CIC family
MMAMGISLSSLKRIPENTRDLVSTIGFAAASGLSAVAFLWLTNLVFQSGIERLATLSPVIFIAGSFGIIASTSLASGVLLRFFAPDAAGSGVPQLKAAYWKDLGFVSLRSTIIKFVAGVLTLGGGTSLGREGPSVFVGGGVASNLAAALGTPKTKRRPPVAAGAAAALAAAFNTPLAAITFVLEEMLNNEFGSRVLGGVVLAAVTGALITQAVLGPQPAFTLPAVEAVSWAMYVVLPLAAAAAALVGVAFQRLTLFLRGWVREHSRLQRWLRPLAGALVTWVLGCTVFVITGHTGVFGLGYGDLSLALDDRLLWEVAGILVLAKFLATVASYAWGGSGGIFSPTLFLGGLTGLFVAGLAGTVLPLTSADRIVLAAVGMSACFNAVVRAPLTALLIVFEMTHQFAMVPALMVCIIVSQSIARLGGRHNFYEELLLQDGHDLIRIKPPRDIESWQGLPVERIARARPVLLPDTEPATLRRTLDAFPYRRFPVGTPAPKGIAMRGEMETALAERRAPKLLPAAFCGPDTTVHDVGQLLMDSPSGAVLVRDPDTGRVTSLVTLHDLLRAQASLNE